MTSGRLNRAGRARRHLLVAWPAGGWVFGAGWWLAGLGLGSFVPLAAAVLAWRAVEDADPAGG
jgi:hypothetical protein